MEQYLIDTEAVKIRSKYSIQTLRDAGLKCVRQGWYCEDEFKRVEKLVDERRKYGRAHLGEKTTLPHHSRVKK